MSDKVPLTESTLEILQTYGHLHLKQDTTAKVRT